MLRIKAEIQIEPLAINELHLESSKYKFFLSRALNIPLEKVSQIRKKRVYFQLKDMITFNFYDYKTKQSVASVFYQFTNDTAIHFITERVLFNMFIVQRFLLAEIVKITVGINNVTY